MNDPRSLSRETAARLGREAVTITRQGHYVAPSGRRVELAGLVADAVRGTTSHPPSERLGAPASPGPHATAVEVRRESTLAAARRLLDDGHDVAALNFASARSPGGGFLSGARAQEESLCRSSALFACLEGQGMYAYHATRDDPLYASWMIYSPRVPVFRDDDGGLLEAPWLCAFVTAPAPNAKEVLERDPGRAGEVRDAMAERIGRVLALSLQRGHDALVLGAWGCGAFGCDGAMVAGEFRAALAGPFRGAFRRVAFAVLDTTPERRFVGPFEAAFG